MTFKGSEVRVESVFFAEPPSRFYLTKRHWDSLSVIGHPSNEQCPTTAKCIPVSHYNRLNRFLLRIHSIYVNPGLIDIQLGQRSINRLIKVGASGMGHHLAAYSLVPEREPMLTSHSIRVAQSSAHDPSPGVFGTDTAWPCTPSQRNSS